MAVSRNSGPLSRVPISGIIVYWSFLGGPLYRFYWGSFKRGSGGSFGRFRADPYKKYMAVSTRTAAFQESLC